MKHLRSLGSRLSITLPTDSDGYLGRECPDADCKGYFKVVPGTGLSGVTLCRCPYCGHSTDQSDFSTPDQIEYAKSHAMRKIMDAVARDLKGLECDIKPKGPFGIGLSVKVQPGRLPPVHLYREKALETHIECPACTLRYAVYGVFAFCPDCGEHNSLQILDRNLEVVGKMLEMAGTVLGDLGGKLIESALESCVSAFDGFGRELCRVHAGKSANPTKAKKVSFQKMEGARRVLQELYGLDLAGGLSEDEWKAALQVFQKRHVLAHRMGIVDDEYIRKTGDLHAVAGRKLVVGADEVRELAGIIGKLARCVSEGFKGLP